MDDEPQDVVRMPGHWFSYDDRILDDMEVDPKALRVFTTLSLMAAEVGRRDATPAPHPIEVEALVERLRMHQRGRMSVKAIRANLDLLHRRGWVVLLPRIAGGAELVQLPDEGPHS